MSETALPVYLVHWDAPQWCRSAVSSILESSGLELDVTVVDNGQTGGPSLRDCLPQGVGVITMPENRGYTGGANAALSDWRARYPDGEFCVIGSHDLHVETTALAQLVATAREHPGGGIVAPALTAPAHHAGGRWSGRHSFQVSPPSGPGVVARDWASGTCLLLRRACVDQIGPFDEQLGSYMEDVDYGLRAKEAGWEVLVVPGAHVWGLGSANPNSLASIAANTVLVNLKRDGVRGAVGSLWFFGASAVRALVGSLLPWRSPARKSASRHFAVQRLAGLARLVVSGRLLRAVRDDEWRRAGYVATGGGRW